jgi:tRNA C32,U32 (ribose-2'-O)-methylase TrmJ
MRKSSPRLEDALVGCNLVLGTSARDRRIPWPLLDPRECGQKVVEEAGRALKSRWCSVVKTPA